MPLADVELTSEEGSGRRWKDNIPGLSVEVVVVSPSTFQGPVRTLDHLRPPRCQGFPILPITFLPPSYDTPRPNFKLSEVRLDTSNSESLSTCASGGDRKWTNYPNHHYRRTRYRPL